MRASEYAGVGQSSDDLSLRQRALLDLASGRFDPWVDPTVPLPAVRVRALVDSGDHMGARAALEGITIDEMRRWSPRDLASVALAASRVGPRQRCRDLLALLADEAGPLLVDGDDEVVPVSFVQALCLMALGRYDDAQCRFDEALALAEQLGPVIGAQVRTELGRFHLGLGPSRGRSARAHLMAAAVCLRANQMDRLADRTTDLLEGDGPVGGAGPDRGVLEPGPRWLVGFGLTAPTRFDDSIGLRALHYLVAHRDRLVPAGELSRYLDDCVHADIENCVGDVFVTDSPGIPDPGDEERVADLMNRTIAALAEADQRLSDHLAAAVTTGSGLRYQPPSAMRWSLGDGI